ncbi:MAG: hypothetical protein J7K61_01405 [Thermoplasmata archaeon]|nr:hypothetical protein [Thermoplasmata archaeon]
MKKIIAAFIVVIFLATPIGSNIQQIKEAVYQNGGGSSVDTYDLLIVAPDEWLSSLEKFVQYKNEHGIRTKLAGLSEAMSMNGRDDAEKLKYYIKYAYDTWHIKYVLLVGGRKPGMEEKWWMPVRYVYNSFGEGFWGEPKFLSDLYFADIYDSYGKFSSWDTNGNGVYGEWRNGSVDKNIDLKPDVFIGRWPARNEYEVKIMVDKTISYEETAYNSNWAKRIVIAAGDTYPEYPGYEGVETTTEALAYLPGYNATTLYTTDGTLTGWKDIVNAVNKGCGILYLDGHGNPMSWTTHMPNSTDWIDAFSVYDMVYLKNKDMYPICVVGGCHNSQFNVSFMNTFKIFKGFSEWYKYLYKGENSPECWSWWMTRKIGGGSVATLGCTALGYTKEDKKSWDGATTWLEPHFFWEYGINGTKHLGEVWGNDIRAYLNRYPIDWNSPPESDSAIDAKTVEEWVLFGDPSLLIGGYS